MREARVMLELGQIRREIEHWLDCPYGDELNYPTGQQEWEVFV